MKKIVSILCVTLPLSALASGYVQADKDKFESTGICENCDLTQTTLAAPSDVEPPYDLSGSNLNDSQLALGNISGSNFEGITGIDMYFGAYSGSLSKTNFKKAYLKNADFSHLNLNYADFTGANLEGVNFIEANLYGAIGMDLSNVYSVCNAILPDGSTGEC